MCHYRNLFVMALFCLSLCAVAAPPSRNALQDKGGAWLLSRQAEDGSWLGQTGQPAFTALACMGLYECPQYQNPEVKAKLDKALDYLVAAAKPDGGIYGQSTKASAVPEGRGGRGDGGQRGGGPGGPGAGGRGGRGGGGGGGGGGGAAYAVYNTSICLVALAKFNRPQDLEFCKKARAYLLDAQSGDEAQSSGGGVGYAQKRGRADLSNTAWTLEALYVTEHLDREPFNTDPAQAAKAGLAWEKALQFVTLCQNLAESNQSAWVKSAPAEDRGGFIYCPEDALKENADAQALRSYGSMTYAGLKSLIYAKVSKEDIRVSTAFDWVKKFYTLDENPGTGASGYYYYLHLFGKTLSLFDEKSITDHNGKTHEWKAELLAKLAETQQEDGAWLNDKSGRWMESIPELSTAYCLITLGMLK